MKTRLSLLLWLAVWLPAAAHEVRPAYLEIRETPAHRVDVLWKQPAMGEVAVHLEPRIGGGLIDSPPTEVDADPGFVLKRWTGLPSPPGGLEGKSVAIDGLDQTITNVLVNAILADGQKFQQILTPQHPATVLSFLAPGGWSASGYLRLGIEHILTGADHLLFVLGLLLLVDGGWRLVKTVTAFTLAHSMTLAAATLGWISARPGMAEALVAASIMFLAAELVRARSGQRSFAAARPWLVAFVFGLLHGQAFAGALASLGLPHADIPLALLAFNIGVEIGQLCFIAAAFAVIWLLRRAPARWPAWLQWLPPYAIGACAAAWFLQRAAAVLA